MKYLLFIFTVLCAPTFASAQEGDRFSKVLIGSSGCAFYTPMQDVVFDLSYSEDSAEVWTASMEDESAFYDIICVRFTETLDITGSELEDLLESYLDFLQDQFFIVEADGYVRGHRMETNPAALGISDQWTDEDAYRYEIKGWVDQHFLAVMIVSGESEPDASSAQIFMNGFRFP